jgi:predicted phosphodiesterase
MKMQNEKSRSKSVVAVSDFHCGAYTGLTPPDWQSSPNTDVGKHQRICWDFYSHHIPKNADVLLVVGDAIDGKGQRSGGTELKVSDRREQCEMALACLLEAKPKKVVLVHGTPYHTGTEEDWESVLTDKVAARRIDATIGSHKSVDVNGLIFDIKHKVGSSQVPHGRHTAISRERLSNQLWAEKGQRPKADIILRGHVHYFNYCGGLEWLAATMPALQDLGCKYGSRQCSGLIDFGFLQFQVDAQKSPKQKPEYDWQAIIADYKGREAKIIKV